MDSVAELAKNTWKSCVFFLESFSSWGGLDSGIWISDSLVGVWVWLRAAAESFWRGHGPFFLQKSAVERWFGVDVETPKPFKNVPHQPISPHPLPTSPLQSTHFLSFTPIRGFGPNRKIMLGPIKGAVQGRKLFKRYDLF